jgi:predicted nucleotidyltransferase
MARLDHALSVLRANADELRRRGVVHAGIFGSVARGDDTDSSDVDVAVEFDPAVRIGLFQMAAIENYLASLLNDTIDLTERHPDLKPRLLAEMRRDCVDAF